MNFMDTFKRKLKDQDDADVTGRILARRLRFSEQDLEINREGYLSTLQIDRIRRNRNALAFRLPIPLIILSLFTVCFVLVRVWQGVIFTGTVELLLAVFAIRRWRSYQAELRMGQVASHQGTIKLGRSWIFAGWYYVKICGTDFILKPQTMLGFKNGGVYAVYYSPRVRRLLSAEWLGTFGAPEKAEKEKVKNSDRPYSSTSLLEHDLEANREGLLSDRQIAELKTRRNRVVSMLPVNFLIDGALVIFFVSARAIPFAVFFGLQSILSIVVAIYRRKQIQADIQDGHVESVQGHIRLGFAFWSKYDCLRIGRLNFSLLHHNMLNFKNGEPYVVYYSPRTKWLLTSEWLREGDG